MRFEAIRAAVAGALTLSRCLLPLALALVCLLPAGCTTVTVRHETASLNHSSLDSARTLRRLSRKGDPRLAEAGAQGIATLHRAVLNDAFLQKAKARAGFLETALATREVLASSPAPSNGRAVDELLLLHRHTLARFAELWSADPRRLAGEPSTIWLKDGPVTLVQAPSSHYAFDFFDRLVAADSIEGRGVTQRCRDGYGAPLVGVREQRPGREEEMAFYPARGLHLPVTLTLSAVREDPETAGGLLVEVALHDPTREDRVPLGDSHFTLAATYSAPMALLLKGRNELLWGLAGFLDAEKTVEEAGIYLLQPYDPERIPVILTHGLISVPMIWRDLVPEFLSEPDLARRYQFLVFTYPSSFPIVDSAELMRDSIAALRQRYDPEGRDPLSRDLVVMGHSMGGILSRMLLAEFGDRLWRHSADIPMESLGLSPEAEDRLRRLVYFEPDGAVRRAVFISTPHGGATLAANPVADFVSRLARLPVDAVTTTLGAFEIPDPDLLKVDLRHKLTSIQSLRTDSPVVLAMKEAPYVPGVPYHSIIGDRGRGDSPLGSDGVVEYWSSHQPGAASELIVPTGHSSYTHPAAVAELKRILREHR